MNQNTNSKSIIILLAILLIAAIGTAGFYWKQTKDLTQTNESVNKELTALETTRDELIADIEGLESDYQELMTSNDSISTLFEKVTMEIAQKQKEIKKIKKDYTTDISGLKSQIQQLETIKGDMTNLVDKLKEENALLMASNKNLENKVSNMESANKALEFRAEALKTLSKELEKENKNLMAASTRASNFRVDIKKKGDKSTSSAKRAREIEVTFDIKNLPANREGTHNLYVVIKDAQGNVVKVDNPVKATIKANANSDAEEILAQQVLSVDLVENTRQKFSINPVSGTLKKGFYRAVVYADWGMLGGAQFQLK